MMQPRSRRAAQQVDPVSLQRLHEGVQLLSGGGFKLDLTRANRRVFVRNFGAFVRHVRAHVQLK